MIDDFLSALLKNLRMVLIICQAEPTTPPEGMFNLVQDRHSQGRIALYSCDNLISCCYIIYHYIILYIILY